MQHLNRFSFGLIALLYFAALTVLLFADVLADPRWMISGPGMDIDMYFLPVRTFIIDEVFSGNLPLWNPFHLGGIPALGNFQYAMFYPLNWVHLFLQVEVALNVVVALHVMLAGLFTAIWCRSRGTSAIGSLLGGTIFMIGGPITMHVYAGYVTYLCVVAWTPLLFMCADAIVEGPRPARAGLWGAGVVALQVLAGYPQPAYFTGMAVCCYVLIRLIGRANWRGAFGWVAMMFLLGAAIASVQLLPGIEAALESNRGGSARYSFSTSFSFAPENLLTLLMPHPFGDGFHAPVFNRWGNVDTSAFIGVVGTCLALVAILRARSTREIAIVVTILLALFIALGRYNPLFRPLLLVVPGLERMRFPSRAIFIISLLGAVLAASGFDQLRLIARPLRGAVLAGVIAIVLAGFGLVIGITAKSAADGPWGRILTRLVSTGETFPKLDKPDAPYQIEQNALYASSQFLAAGGSLILVAAVLVSLRKQPRWVYLLPVLAIGELWAGSDLAWLRFRRAPLPPPAWESAISKMGRDDRAVVMTAGMQNLTIPLRLEGAGGYDPAVLARWDALVGPMLGSEARTGNLEMRRLRPSVRWEMLRLGATLPLNDQITVNPMQRVALIDQVKIVSGPDDSLLAVREPDFDPRKMVILEQPPDPTPVQGNEPPGTVSILSVGTDEVEFVAELSRPAILLVTDGYSKGWRARSLAGAGASRYNVFPANHALRAIPLAAGTHHILLEYQPATVRLGFVISIGSLVLWCACLLRLGWSRGTPGPQAVDPPQAGHPDGQPDRIDPPALDSTRSI